MALKIIDKSVMRSKHLEMLRSEIEILKICQHPHIVKTYDILETSRTLFICKKVYTIFFYFLSYGIMYRRYFIIKASRKGL
jgi:serine/threonine protein kinase